MDAIAFNLGSDARICGLPRSANPYTFAEPWNRKCWDGGWVDVETSWGKLVRFRWVYRMVLGVVEDAA